MQHWNYSKGVLEIKQVPFYWRLKENANSHSKIPSKMDFRFGLNEEFGYFEYRFSEDEKDMINLAYRENENIGFLKPGSGQMDTYGASSNDFFLNMAQKYKPMRVLEIGCGSGLTLVHLNKNGFTAEGIDPSEYSKKCSEEYKFPLINDFFPMGIEDQKYDMIFCNDVYEHVFDVFEFSKEVFNSLTPDGIFCISTTNSTRSINIGDISMLEHQHVNMFTDHSIYKILKAAGFNYIEIQKGTYGNTLQICATRSSIITKLTNINETDCSFFFEKAIANIERFEKFYKQYENIGFYVPLRSFGYMATVNAQNNMIYDSNKSWHNKYIDGYSQPISDPQKLISDKIDVVFVGSLTFYKDIKKFCNDLGIKRVVCIEEL